MNQDVVAWCRDCQHCARAKVTKQPAAAVQPIPVPRHRFTHVHVEHAANAAQAKEQGGELPALTLIDAVVRLLPGVMTDAVSAQQDSFSDGLLEGPHFTRPEVFGGVPVPEVLMSGHHARIARWRREASLRVTAQRRPDLIDQARRQGRLSKADLAHLDSLDEPGAEGPQNSAEPGGG
jgi:tRNA (guanine37-N1)-methyltransferase